LALLARNPAPLLPADEALDRLAAADDLLAALPENGVTVVAWRDAWQVGARRVMGAWDPVLRRIELFDVALRSPEQLVRTLAHEMAHMAGIDDEAAAGASADRVVARLTPAQVARASAALTAAARTGVPS
jgi:hypothetical protein